MKLACISLLFALFAEFLYVLETDFDRGVAAYQRADYAAARASWLAELERPDADRASVLYNLGNTAFREKRPLEAVAWYTASLRESPRSSDAWHNLEFARREAGLEPADRGDLRATGARLVNSLTLAEAERVVIGACVLLALCFLWEALRGGRPAKWASGIAAGVVVLACVPWIAQLVRDDSASLIVIQPEGATLFSEPRDAAAVIGRLAPATEAAHLDQIPGWLRVRGKDGELGWVSETAVLAITDQSRTSTRR